jgi:hypothetical protein
MTNYEAATLIGYDYDGFDGDYETAAVLARLGIEEAA